MAGIVNNVSDVQVRLIGYCDKDINEIASLIRVNRIDKLTSMSGEYTVVYTRKKLIGVITSRIGAIDYYYYYDGRQFFHGEEILRIVKDAKIEWEWDYESLGDLCELENLTEERSLHKRIKRVPPFSVLQYERELVIFSKKLISTFKEEKANPIEAIRIFNTETRKWVSNSPFISLSGGFDSRLILSSMLNSSIYPSVVTVGKDDSSDVRVAKKISRRYGLEHRVVELELKDLLENGEEIARITNGSKPSCHWNTYLYPKKAFIPRNESFYVGTLGEFARNYYFDKGILGLLLDGMPHYVQERFWQQKILRHRCFTENEIPRLTNELEKQLNLNGVAGRAKRNRFLSGKGFLDGGSKYYLEQRVPNFYANGIRMYNATSNWRSPFHNIEWLNGIWNLGQTWKLGSNWHRLAIKRNWPELLGFPEEKGYRQDIMMDKAVPFYWHPIMQRSKYKTYDQSRLWYKTREVKEVIMDNRDLLSVIMDTQMVEDILTEHNQRENRTKTISFLLTVVYFCIAKTRLQ